MTRSQTANLSGTVMTPAVRGLSSSEAQRRLAQTGPNELRREQAASRVVLLARQFASPVIWLLAGAAVVSTVFGEFLDAGAIGAIVLINAVIGFVQEHRAERAIQALRSMTAPKARVLRDGASVMVASGIYLIHRERKAGMTKPPMGQVPSDA